MLRARSELQREAIKRFQEGAADDFCVAQLAFLAGLVSIFSPCVLSSAVVLATVIRHQLSPDRACRSVVFFFLGVRCDDRLR